MKENVERKIEIHFTGECQQESFSRFSSDNVTSHLSTQKKNCTRSTVWKKINKKGKIDNFHVFYRTKKKKERKKEKNIRVWGKKRGEASKKKSVFPFFPFLRYGKKIPSALGESCGNRNFSFNLIEQSYCVYRRDRKGDLATKRILIFSIFFFCLLSLSWKKIFLFSYRFFSPSPSDHPSSMLLVSFFYRFICSYIHTHQALASPASLDRNFFTHCILIGS